MTAIPPKLYEVPENARTSRCECGAEMAWTRMPSGALMPLSIGSELAEKDEAGRILRAPSHYVDCPRAGKFSGRNRNRGK